jgi:hypothetical protein
MVSAECAFSAISRICAISSGLLSDQIVELDVRQYRFDPVVQHNGRYACDEEPVFDAQHGPLQLRSAALRPSEGSAEEDVAGGGETEGPLAWLTGLDGWLAVGLAGCWPSWCFWSDTLFTFPSANSFTAPMQVSRRQCSRKLGPNQWQQRGIGSGHSSR